MVDCELIALLTAIACGITKCLSVDDIAILAASFTQLGDTLATYLVQVEIAEKRSEENQADKSKGKDQNQNNIREPLELRGEEP